jgi:6-phosphogluconate dehydrogenase (decarboxylating)
MVHNGIEYGLMHAYGEGYQLLRACELGVDAVGVVARGGRAASSAAGCWSC